LGIWVKLLYFICGSTLIIAWVTLLFAVCWLVMSEPLQACA